MCYEFVTSAPSPKATQPKPPTSSATLPASPPSSLRSRRTEPARRRIYNSGVLAAGGGTGVELDVSAVPGRVPPHEPYRGFVDFQRVTKTRFMVPMRYHFLGLGALREPEDASVENQRFTRFGFMLPMRVHALEVPALSMRVRGLTAFGPAVRPDVHPRASPALIRQFGHSASGASGARRPLAARTDCHRFHNSPSTLYTTDCGANVTGAARKSSAPGQHAKEKAPFHIYVRRGGRSVTSFPFQARPIPFAQAPQGHFDRPSGHPQLGHQRGVGLRIVTDNHRSLTSSRGSPETACTGLDEATTMLHGRSAFRSFAFSCSENVEFSRSQASAPCGS